MRWLRLLTPVLLVVFAVSAFRATAAPGLTGRHLAVSIAVVAFALGVLGANTTDRRPFEPQYVGCTAAVVASSVLLMVLQPDGPGAAGVLLAALLVARLVPRRAVVPVLVSAFVALEVGSAVTGQSFGYLAILAAIAAFYGMLVLAYRLAAANRRAESLLTEVQESQAAQARAAGLAERQRLAREMHDVLAHSLSGLMVQLEGARMLAAQDPSDPRLPETIDRAHGLGKAGLAEARQAIGMLRDDDLPGPERLAALAAQFEQDRGIPCRLTIRGQAHALDAEARLALYRVAQEALTNIAKHAHPDRVEMHLAYEAAHTHLVVEDFAAAAAARAVNGPGFGLTGMRERAELLGGTLVTAATGSGFRVELDVPA